MTHHSRRHELQHLWDQRAHQWGRTVETSPAFAVIRDRMMELAAPETHDRCLDLGAGTGFLTVRLAERAGAVTALDLSGEMLRRLRAAADAAGVRITTRHGDMAGYQQPTSSLDLVVSSYALHYLTDADKRALLRAVHSWLVPGGRLVIADMMIGRSIDSHHRRVLWSKVRAMGRAGPAGWWRLVVNIARIVSNKGRLHPCPPHWWLQALTDVGFTDVHYEHVLSEAGIVTAHVPLRAAGQKLSAYETSVVPPRTATARAATTSLPAAATSSP